MVNVNSIQCRIYSVSSCMRSQMQMKSTTKPSPWQRLREKCKIKSSYDIISTYCESCHATKYHYYHHQIIGVPTPGNVDGIHAHLRKISYNLMPDKNDDNIFRGFVEHVKCENHISQSAAGRQMHREGSDTIAELQSLKNVWMTFCKSCIPLHLQRYHTIISNALWIWSAKFSAKTRINNSRRSNFGFPVLRRT